MRKQLKKQSKTQLKKKLDKEFGRIICSRGRCARCGRGAEEVTLQCSHIIGRTNHAVRWDIDNGVCLCYRCHIHWWHKEPLEAQEWVKEYLGEMKLEALKARARATKQWELWEMEHYLKMLQGIK